MLKFKKLIESGVVSQAIAAVLQQKKNKLRANKKLLVCFFVSEKQFWSMESIYEALKKYSCFQLFVVPFPTSYHVCEERKVHFEELCNFHKERGHRLIHVCDYDNNLLISPDEFLPDIIFYEQHWMANYQEAYQIYNMAHKALCICIPYGVMIANIPQHQFNGDTHNLVWRNFVESPMHLSLAKKYAYNKGINTIVSGYSKFDDYARPVKKIYWKTDNPAIKRIIWAPHYSINTNSAINFSTFLSYFTEILSLVKRNPDKFEFIMRPHPALKSQCTKVGFTEDVYNAYMDEWNKLPNASIVRDGNYLDLFKTSDAIILDSLSFISEYMLTGKPMCFLSKFSSYEELVSHFNEYGKRAMSFIDIAYNFAEVYQFLANVWSGRAKVSEARNKFVNSMLKVNYGHVGEFIADHVYTQLTAE